MASTSVIYCVPHSHSGINAFPRVRPKFVTEYSTFGGISPKSTRSMMPSACNSLSCWMSTLSLTSRPPVSSRRSDGLHSPDGTGSRVSICRRAQTERPPSRRSARASSCQPLFLSYLPKGAYWKQTVRKLQGLSIKWRKERAEGIFSRFRAIGRLMRPEGLRNARIRADEPHCLKPRRRRSSPRRRGC